MARSPHDHLGGHDMATEPPLGKPCIATRSASPGGPRAHGALAGRRCAVRRHVHGLDRLPAVAARRPRRFPRRCVRTARLSLAGARVVSPAARTRGEQRRDPAPVRGHAAHGRARRDPDPRHRRQRAARTTGHVHRRGPAGDAPARGDRRDAVHFEPGLDRRRRGVGRGGRRDVRATEFRRVVGLQSTHDPAARAAGRFAGRLGAVLRDADPQAALRELHPQLRAAAAQRRGM